MQITQQIQIGRTTKTMNAEDIVKIAAAAVGIAFAVAFGVGGIDTAKRWWARYLAPREAGGR